MPHEPPLNMPLNIGTYKNVFLNYCIFHVLETGGLFMLAIRLMQLFSDSTNDFTKLTGILGLYFQIRDDYCNLCLQEVRFIACLL